MQSRADLGVEVLTLYAFSSENWRRSAEEIADLTGLMRFYLERELATLDKEGVRLRLIGDYSAFGPDLVARLERAIAHTADNARLTLVVALNYGSRAEIAAAARTLAVKAAAGALDPARSTKRRSPRAPDRRSARPRPADPHLGRDPPLQFPLVAGGLFGAFVRRHFWPDFDEQAFADAIADYAARERRFGGRGAEA